VCDIYHPYEVQKLKLNTFHHNTGKMGIFLINPSSRTTALGLTQPLTEMSTRNLPGEQSATGA
jgi:hypothetical protein